MQRDSVDVDLLQRGDQVGVLVTQPGVPSRFEPLIPKSDGNFLDALGATHKATEVEKFRSRPA